MSQFHSLDELVSAGESHVAHGPAVLPAAPPADAPDQKPDGEDYPADDTQPKRRLPRSGKKHTRLTATPDFMRFVSDRGAQPSVDSAAADSTPASQGNGGVEVAPVAAGQLISVEIAPATSAGEQQTPNRVSQTQVAIAQHVPEEVRELLLKIGVNLHAVEPGRKHVLDEFMRGRLVSLLAMGLTLRQAAAALGLSHVSIWKALRKDETLAEEVNAARFQAQIEPLLVILRESKRSWRAATWLIGYMNKWLNKRESALADAVFVDKEASVAHARERAQMQAECEIQEMLGRQKVRQARERIAYGIPLDRELKEPRRRGPRKPKANVQ